MEKKIRIGVIFGGRSGEHEVSLVSASSIIHALDKDKYEVIPIGIAPDGRWLSSANTMSLLKTKSQLADEPERIIGPEPHRRELVSVEHNAPPEEIDVVFPIVHGTYGEDGTLQGLLELADIPYVGAGVLGSALGMDKVLQKKVFKQEGLPIVKYVWVLSSEVGGQPKKIIGLCEKSLRYPMFVKPANTGSSVGITKAHNRKELLNGLTLAATFDRKVIVEEGVKGVREIECSVLGNDSPIASIPGEIIPGNEFYDYDAKYVNGNSTSVIPADLPKKAVKEIQRLAVGAFRSLDCWGMARVDFFVTSRGKIYLNEINTIPGFTSISIYPKLWEASGLAYPDLLDKLITLAFEMHASKSTRATSYSPSSAWYNV